MRARAEGDEVDCETADDWLWHQDVNTWSSLAFLLVGGWLAGAVVRRRIDRSFGVLALVVLLEGSGSVAYHGLGGEGASALHDISLLGVVGFLAGWHAGRIAHVPEKGALTGTAITMAVGGALWPAFHGVTSVAFGLAVGVIVLSELVARRRHERLVWTRGPVVLASLAALMWILGRDGSPLCAPDSTFQWHGLWHAFSAALVVVWVDAATAAARPHNPSRLWRSATDRALGLLTIAAVYAFHRSVETLGRDRIPQHGPTLGVANHGNGLVDPVVVASVSVGSPASSPRQRFGR